MTVYAKNEKESLTRQECNDVKRVIDFIEKGLSGKKP